MFTFLHKFVKANEFFFTAIIAAAIAAWFQAATAQLRGGQHDISSAFAESLMSVSILFWAHRLNVASKWSRLTTGIVWFCVFNLVIDAGILITTLLTGSLENSGWATYLGQSIPLVLSVFAALYVVVRTYFDWVQKKARGQEA